MLTSTSVKKRLLVSIGSNGIRTAMSFFTGLLIARALNPSAYGDLMFLLGSFVTIRSLLDMGSASAFFTALSRNARGNRFYLFYFLWLTLQFVLTLLLVAVLIPTGVFEKIWLGHNREIVALAFLASFMQQQVWQTIGQIGEAKRKTIKVQFLNLVVAIAYLGMVSILSVYRGISVENILLLLIAQYGLATLFSFWILREKEAQAIEEEKSSFKQILGEYKVYCQPLIALSIVSFSYGFADKWMLQRFGGAAQQGYFQIASQFSVISLLATSSILSVFWKEVAAAWTQKDTKRVAKLYHKANRGLVMLGAMLTGLMLPWSEQIVSIFLGPAYLHAWPVLAIMFLYPIHQSMGQIGSTMFFASGQTKKYMLVSSFVMLVSMPVSYFMLAPASGAPVPGFGLGAIGMAAKMVLLGMISVNIQAWVIARHCGWKLDWLFQVVGIPLMLGLGYLAKALAGFFWDLQIVSLAALIMPVVFAGLIYVLSVIAVIWLFPWFIGMERGELRHKTPQSSTSLT
jgi:O-antigen/teichoic acid export membrane protein